MADEGQSVTDTVESVVDAAMAGSEPGEAGSEPLTNGADAPLEAIEPHAMWPEEYRNQFTGWGKLEGGRGIQEAVLGHYTAGQVEFDRMKQEGNDAMRQNHQWNEATAQFQDMINRTGATPQEAYRQAMGLLASMQADPSGTLMKLARTANVDLAKLVGEQPYQSEEELARDQRYDRIEQRLDASDRNAQGQQIQWVTQQLNAFANAKDAEGYALHPHFQEVQSLMAWSMNQNQGISLEDAYADAIRRSPALMADENARNERAEAERKSREAIKAKGAARKPDGKPGAKDDPVSQKEAIGRAYDKSVS